MPSRPTHRALGVMSGTVCVLDLLPKVPAQGRFALVLGASMGGWAGGVLPDVLEPAEHPHHRDICHSLSALAAVGIYWRAKAQEHVALLLARAAASREVSLNLRHSDPNRGSLLLREQAYYFAAGALRGALAGYVSHLAADAVTPRGVPLIVRSVV